MDFFKAVLMRFLLVLLFFVSIAPLLLATDVVVYFEDNVGVEQTQIYTFSDSASAENFASKYEALVRKHRDGVFFQKPLDVDEVQIDLASFCTQMHDVSADGTKFALYARYGMRVVHKTNGLSPLEESLLSENCVINLKNPKLKQSMAERMLSGACYQRICPDFRCAEKILKVLSKDPEMLGDRYDTMPFGKKLDFDLSDIEVRDLTNVISLLSHPNNPWCVDDVMSQLRNAGLEKLLRGREAKLRWLLSNGNGHRPTYMYKGFAFRGFSSGDAMELVRIENGKLTPGKNLLIFFEHGLSPRYGRPEDGLLEKDSDCDVLCERNMSGRLTPTMNGLNPQSMVGHTLLYGNSCTLSSSVACRYASSELLSGSCNRGVTFLMDLRKSCTAHYVDGNFQSYNKEVNEEKYIPGNCIVGAWPMCNEEVFFPNPHWKANVSPAFCTIPMPKQDYAIEIIKSNLNSSARVRGLVDILSEARIRSERLKNIVCAA